MSEGKKEKDLISKAYLNETSFYQYAVVLPYFQLLQCNQRSTFGCESTLKSIIMHFPFLLFTSTFSMQPFHTLWHCEDAGIRKADGVLQKVSMPFHNAWNNTRDLFSNIKPWTSELIKGGSLNYEKKNYKSYFIINSCKCYMFKNSI